MDVKPCPFCGHPRSRLIHRTEYRRNYNRLVATEDLELGFGDEVDMLDFRHVFYRRCNKCGAKSKFVRTDWHVRTKEEAEEFSLSLDLEEKLWPCGPNSEWAKPWRDKADEVWNMRITD